MSKGRGGAKEEVGSFGSFGRHIPSLMPSTLLSGHWFLFFPSFLFLASIIATVADFPGHCF